MTLYHVGMKRRVLRIDGRDDIEEVGNGYKDWNRAIGAGIGELVVCPGGVLELWCDEEGLYNSPVLNFTATALAGRRIVGDVILFKRGDVQ